MSIENVELTPEMQEQLRLYGPITPRGEFDYVPVAFRRLPDSYKATFRLRGLTGPEKALAEDDMYAAVETEGTKSRIVMKRGRFAINVCRGRVIGWKNYRSADGNEIAFDPKLDCIPDLLIHELANEIASINRNVLSDNEKLGLE